MVGGRHLKGAGTGHHLAVLQGVQYCPQAVTDGVLDLRNGVVVGALDEHRARLGVLHILHKRVLLLTQGVLVHRPSVSKRLWNLYTLTNTQAGVAETQPPVMLTSLIRSW